MRRYRSGVRSASVDLRAWKMFALVLLVAAAFAGSAFGSPGTTSAAKKPANPPAQVDPKMRVTPKPHAAMPTPVVKPPATNDQSVIVPK